MSRIGPARSVAVPCMCAIIAIIIFGPFGSDAGDQPLGALPGPLVRESGAHVQPRSRIVHQHAALVSGLGGVLLAWTTSLCPPLVGAAAAFGVTRHAPDPVVR